MIRVCIPAIFLLSQVVGGASEFDDLAKALPVGANTVLLIDADRILSTEMAKANGWGDTEKAADRPLYLPAEAEKVIVAAQVDPMNRFSQSWEAAVISLNESMPMRLIAKAEGGYTDTINGKQAAWTPSDSYFIQLDDDTLGLMHPANKQAAARWIDGQQKAGSTLSSYLQEAVDGMALGPHFVLALDTKDAIPAHRIHQKLTESETGLVAKHKLDLDTTVELFTSLQGVTLDITLSDKAQAEARIQFERTVMFGADVAKEFVLSSLTSLGADIPGVDAWTFRVEHESIIAEGELPLPGLRRILSMVEIPTTKFSSLKDENTETEGSAEEIASKSLAYYQSATKLIEDLERHSKSSSGDNYWFDRYAKKIERLPILHVDADLLNFGQKTAETLRVMSGARKSANLSAGVSQANIGASSGDGYSGSYRSGYGRYGNYYRGSGYASSSSRASAQQRSQNAANKRFQRTATSKKIEGFRLINDASYELRRKMTERYDIEF